MFKWDLTGKNLKKGEKIWSRPKERTCANAAYGVSELALVVNSARHLDTVNPGMLLTGNDTRARERGELKTRPKRAGREERKNSISFVDRLPRRLFAETLLSPVAVFCCLFQHLCFKELNAPFCSPNPSTNSLTRHWPLSSPGFEEMLQSLNKVLRLKKKHWLHLRYMLFPWWSFHHIGRWLMLNPMLQHRLLVLRLQ